jgi:hypothetical protein
MVERPGKSRHARAIIPDLTHYEIGAAPFPATAVPPFLTQKD